MRFEWHPYHPHACEAKPGIKEPRGIVLSQRIENSRFDQTRWRCAGHGLSDGCNIWSRKSVCALVRGAVVRARVQARRRRLGRRKRWQRPKQTPSARSRAAALSRAPPRRHFRALNLPSRREKNRPKLYVHDAGHASRTARPIRRFTRRKYARSKRGTNPPGQARRVHSHGRHPPRAPRL